MNHPTLTQSLTCYTACFLVWMAVGYIAVIQLTGGF